MLVAVSTTCSPRSRSPCASEEGVHGQRSYGGSDGDEPAYVFPCSRTILLAIASPFCLSWYCRLRASQTGVQTEENHTHSMTNRCRVRTLERLHVL